MWIHEVLVHLFFQPVFWGGICCAASQGSLHPWICPTPCQGAGLSVSWLSVWFLFPGGFLCHVRGSEQQGLCPVSGLELKDCRPLSSQPSGTKSSFVGAKLHRLLWRMPTTVPWGESPGPASATALCVLGSASYCQLTHTPCSAAPGSQLGAVLLSFPGPLPP